MLMRWMGAVLCVLSVGCGSDEASGDGSGGSGGGAGGGLGGSGATGGASTGGSAGSGGASGGAGGASGGGSGGSGGVVDPTAPAWVSALTPGEWIPISGPNPGAGLSPTNHAEDIDPDADDGYSGNTGFSAVLEAWNGGAFAPGLGASGSLLCFGGGHNDYHSNEVIRFDVASREWSVLKLPYSEGTYSPPYENGLFPDGSPNPSHTYNQVEYHPGTNSLLIGRAQISDNPSNAPIIPMLDLTTLEWRHSPVNSPAHSHTGGWSAYDSMRDRLWLEGGGTGTTLTRFDPNADNGDGTFGTFENHSAILATVGNSAAYSPLHDAVIIVYESGEELWGFDPVAPGDGVELTVGSPPEFGYYSSLAWSAKRSSFIYYPGTGSALYELTVSGDWKTGTWSFENLTTGGDDPGAPGRVLSKLRIAKYGDTEVVIMAYAVDAPVYAFVLP